MTDTLNGLLKQTARSFYLTLRVLPAAVRPQIGLAYLLPAPGLSPLVFCPKPFSFQP